MAAPIPITDCCSFVHKDCAPRRLRRRLLEDIITTVQDPFLGFEALALASLCERSELTAKLEKLPPIPRGSRRRRKPKSRLSRAWLRCWRNYGFWLAPHAVHVVEPTKNPRGQRQGQEGQRQIRRHGRCDQGQGRAQGLQREMDPGTSVRCLRSTWAASINCVAANCRFFLRGRGCGAPHASQCIGRCPGIAHCLDCGSAAVACP